MVLYAENLTEKFNRKFLIPNYIHNSQFSSPYKLYNLYNINLYV